MGLEDIQKKIISDAEQKKAELLATAEQQQNTIIDQGKKLTNEYKEDQHKSALSAAENLERGLIIDARRKLANEILARKRKRIEQVFEKAKAEFLSSSEYKDIMKALVTGSTQSKKEQVLLGMNEKALDQKWLDDVNSTAGASLSFSKDKGNFEGGLLLVEGESFINITADTLFALLREDAEKPVADILFRG